jgi:hypothetical protein
MNDTPSTESSGVSNSLAKLKEKIYGAKLQAMGRSGEDPKQGIVSKCCSK